MEDYSRRKQRIDGERIVRVGHVELSLTARGIDAEIAVPDGSQPQLLRHTDARNTILQVGGMQSILAVAIEDILYSAQFGEVVIDSFELNHHLVVLVDGESLIFKAYRRCLNLRQSLQLKQLRVVSLHRLTLCRLNLNLWVEVGEERRHKVGESIESAENDNQCGRSHGYTDNRNDADDVYCVRALLREDVPLSYVEWKIHKVFIYDYPQSTKRQRRLYFCIGYRLEPKVTVRTQ